MIAIVTMVSDKIITFISLPLGRLPQLITTTACASIAGEVKQDALHTGAFEPTGAIFVEEKGEGRVRLRQKGP